MAARGMKAPAPRVRPGRRALLFSATVVLAACGGSASPDGRAIVDRSLRRMGGADPLERAGGLVVEARGWYDKTAERQGWSMDTVSRGSFVERLAIDRSGTAVGYAYREERFDGTREALREIYEGDDRRLIVVPSEGFAVDLRSPEHVRARRKLLRRVPALLLGELLDGPEPLRLSRAGGGGDTLRASGVLADGTDVALRFGRADTLLRSLTYETDLPSFGDTDVTWSWDDYREVAGVGVLPHRYGVTVGARTLTDMRVTRVDTGAAAVASLLEVPGRIEVRAPRDVDPSADASANARVDTLGRGIFRVTNLRGGFHPLFVRVGDGLIAVDAPAGYPLPNELPAGDVAPGPSAEWLSRRYIDLMREAVPGVPVTHVVVTHFHGDHGGGVRAFVAEGAAVVASAADTAELRASVGAPHPDRDRRAAEPRGLRVEAVEGRWTLREDGRALEVLEVGPNPHTRGMLVLHLPDDGVMFVSDLLDPTRDPLRFPRPDHAALDAWFGRWLRDRDLSPERIYTMHGSGLATPAHLERLEGGPGA